MNGPVTTETYKAGAITHPTEHHGKGGWSPYQDNGGTVLAVCGEDYCVVAGDTRMSVGYSINSRTVPKLAQLTSRSVLASSGMQADALGLQKNLKARIVMYEHQTGKEMSTPAIAQMLSTTLYYKRFFPFYTFNVLGGLDADGRGCVYTYDAIGSYERAMYASSGSGSLLVQPVLDSQVGFKNQPKEMHRQLSVAEAVDLVKDVITSAGERDIYTGDFVDVYIITRAGVQKDQVQLRLD